MTEARKPARVTSVKSLFFLSPITIAQDHIPSIPCTALSDKARSQSFCWMKENCRSLSATKQNIPKPTLEITDAVLKVWRRAWAFSVSDAMTKTMSQNTKCHQDTHCTLSFVWSVLQTSEIRKKTIKQKKSNCTKHLLPQLQLGC